jgi:hypothetical protein
MGGKINLKIPLTRVRIHYDSRNYTVTEEKGFVWCYSYQSPVCVWNPQNNMFTEVPDAINTATTQRHVKKFKEWCQENLLNI